MGASCQDSIVVSVGTPPTVEIIEPQSGEVFSLGTDILFHGSLLDAEDAMNDIDVSWTSSSAGEIVTGSPDSQGSISFQPTLCLLVYIPFH